MLSFFTAEFELEARLALSCFPSLAGGRLCCSASDTGAAFAEETAGSEGFPGELVICFSAITVAFATVEDASLFDTSALWFGVGCSEGLRATDGPTLPLTTMYGLGLLS